MENDQIKVWRLRLNPGESSDLHHHELDYVMVQIAGDVVAARFEPDSTGTFAGSEYLEGVVKPGTAIYAEGGGRETAINVGEETFHEVVIELKGTEKTSSAMMPLQHVSLSVTDFEAAIGFYTDILGFEQMDRPDFGFPGAWLKTGNGVQIHLIEDPNFVAPAGPHVAFETKDMDAELARLRSLGVEVGDDFEMNGTRQAFFYDPSGNQFELNQPVVNP